MTKPVSQADADADSSDAKPAAGSKADAGPRVYQAPGQPKETASHAERKAANQAARKAANKAARQADREVPSPDIAPNPKPVPGPKHEPKAEAPARPTPPPPPAAPAAAPPSATPALDGVAPPARRPVSSARPRLRHMAVLVSFLIWVAAPSALGGYYLWTVAADQYASKVGFSVRREEVSSPVELLGGLADFSGSSSSDTDILYEFIQSQKLVSDIDQEIDLRTIWSQPEGDFIFAYDAPGTIEDLVEYWNRMVRLSYDSSAGLIEVEVRSFDATSATLIAERIFDKSSDMINELSSIAQEDAIRFAREELDAALERLKQARETVTRFRNTNQLVDPSLDLQSQAGLLGSLQTQLAEQLIELDMLEGNTSAGDPRVTQATRRVEVIRDRIAAERQKLGITADTDDTSAFADLVGEYERLVVDREFAETAYTSALANFDAARAEARRKSRYLAAYLEPTRAESAAYPERFTLFALFGLFLFLSWSIVTLVLYSLKDRR